MGAEGGPRALVRLHYLGEHIDPEYRNGRVGYNRGVAIVDPYRYAGITLFGRVQKFVENKFGDIFKLINNITSIATTTLDLEPAQVRQLVGIGKGAKTFASGLDAMGLPGNVRELISNPSPVTFCAAVDSSVKVYKFGKGMNFWAAAPFDADIHTVQNLSGIVTSSSKTYEDITGLIKLYNKWPQPGAPELNLVVHNNRWRGGMVSLIKNIARIAINVIAAAGAIFAMAVWAPVVVGLATVGTVGSIVSYFFKQNADILEANARIAELENHRIVV